MTPSFNEQFDQLSRWRKGLAAQLAAMREWLDRQELLDAAVQEHLQRLETQLHNDKVNVAFVADFSRGKSELINALFFASYGRRIMPATSGCTTMCPVELGYDPQLPIGLRLLPVETRLQPYSLAEWRERPSIWVQFPLDVDDPEQLASKMAKVAEMYKVSVDEAEALGFWSNDDALQDAPLPDSQGMIEIPRWRHALVNMPHPLFKQGLEILDAPGLNAVGTEPELTVNLIGQAQAVVFLLAAETGVTPSDLAIWYGHLVSSHRNDDAQLVAINKIDTVWEHLESEPEVPAHLLHLRTQSARHLGIEPSRVLLLSGRKGWQAKAQNNADLLQRSGLQELEDALAQCVLQHRQHVLHSTVTDRVTQLQAQVRRTLEMREHHWDEQLQALRALSGQGDLTADEIHRQIEQEQQAFAGSDALIQNIRSRHLRLMHQAFQHLGVTALRRELDQLAHALEHSELKSGVHNVYAATFENLYDAGIQVRATASEIQSMLNETFSELNNQFGFILQPPSALQLDTLKSELAQLEESYLQYLSSGNAVLKLSNPLFAQGLLKVLGMRLRGILETAASDLDLWSMGAMSQIEVQRREYQRSFTRRLRAIERIQQNTENLSECFAEIDIAKQQLAQQRQYLTEWGQQLQDTPFIDDEESGAASKA